MKIKRTYKSIRRARLGRQRVRKMLKSDKDFIKCGKIWCSDKRNNYWSFYCYFWDRQRNLWNTY